MSPTGRPEGEYRSAQHEDLPSAPPAADASAIGWDAIVIHPDDDVAVAIRDLPSGSDVAFRRGGTTEKIRVVDTIQLGHKLALHPIAADAIIRKYGEVIGMATDRIGAGAHVHVHNMKSRRARRAV